jgi:hypothetical protein
MLTLGPGNLGAGPLSPSGLEVAPPAWVAPGAALAGTVAGFLAPDACSGGFALPISAWALTLTGTVLWFLGVSPERRNRIALAIGVAVGLLTLAALQQLLACVLSRTGMLTPDLLRGAGLLVLFVAIAAELYRRRRARTTAVAPPSAVPRTRRFAPSVAQVAGTGARDANDARSASFSARPNAAETSR